MIDRRTGVFTRIQRSPGGADLAIEEEMSAAEAARQFGADWDTANEELELLAMSEGERRALGLAARRAVEKRWSWTRVAERLLEPFGI